MPTEDTAFRQIAPAALVATGLIHAAYVPQYLLYGAHFGLLFVAAATVCVSSALLLLRRTDTVAWTVAAAAWAGMVVLYAVGRTTHAPGFQSWEGIGFVIAEGLFLLVWIQRALVKRRRSATTRRP